MQPEKYTIHDSKIALRSRGASKAHNGGSASTDRATGSVKPHLIVSRARPVDVASPLSLCGTVIQMHTPQGRASTHSLGESIARDQSRWHNQKTEGAAARTCDSERYLLVVMCLSRHRSTQVHVMRVIGTPPISRTPQVSASIMTQRSCSHHYGKRYRNGRFEVKES